MRLTIFGSTGGTGRQLVSQALAAGHHVVAVARRPQALPVSHDRLVVVRADVLDAASLDQTLTGADAVVSAIGIGYSRAATEVYSTGMANIIAAMWRASVRRLLCVSTIGLVIPPDGPLIQRLVFRHVLHNLLKRPYADMFRMEHAIQRSGLDWTIVRAARLTNGRHTGRYRTAVNATLRGAWSISRADLAGYLLGHLDDGYVKEATVEIAY
jgi:putative NADH-flavin reductase